MEARRWSAPSWAGEFTALVIRRPIPVSVLRFIVLVPDHRHPRNRTRGSSRLDVRRRLRIQAAGTCARGAGRMSDRRRKAGPACQSVTESPSAECNMTVGTSGLDQCNDFGCRRRTALRSAGSSRPAGRHGRLRFICSHAGLCPSARGRSVPSAIYKMDADRFRCVGGVCIAPRWPTRRVCRGRAARRANFSHLADDGSSWPLSLRH